QAGQLVAPREREGRRTAEGDQGEAHRQRGRGPYPARPDPAGDAESGREGDQRGGAQQVSRHEAAEQLVPPQRRAEGRPRLGFLAAEAHRVLAALLLVVVELVGRLEVPPLDGDVPRGVDAPAAEALEEVVE